MPHYIEKMLNKFQHPPPANPQHLPHKHTPLKYGIQVAQPKDITPLLLNAQCKHMQKIVGTLLHYSHAVDPTLACTLSSIAVCQMHGKISGLDACHQLLDYITIHLHAAIRYHTSKMILAVHPMLAISLNKTAKAMLVDTTSSLIRTAMHQTMVLFSPSPQ